MRFRACFLIPVITSSSLFRIHFSSEPTDTSKVQIKKNIFRWSIFYTISSPFCGRGIKAMWYLFKCDDFLRGCKKWKYGLLYCHFYPRQPQQQQQPRPQQQQQPRPQQQQPRPQQQQQQQPRPQQPRPVQQKPRPVQQKPRKKTVLQRFLWFFVIF